MRVLELFSGIGGLHWALKECGIEYELVLSLELNPIVLETYGYNFPEVNLQNRNIESLSAEEINKLEIDAIIMSPPCQPFCRMGNGNGSNDARSSPLNHILNLLTTINFKYIFIENVVGFEVSDVHAKLLKTLEDCCFKCQEFLINPLEFGIPNSRLRYYLIGKHNSIPWTFDTTHTIQTSLPPPQLLSDNYVKLQNNLRNIYTRSNTDLMCVGDILEPLSLSEEIKYIVPLKTLKYINAVDIVNSSSTQSCCFTKAYSHYLTGTGSILDINSVENVKQRCKDNISEIKLRYFTPKEICRLLCFPEEFKFPDETSLKQRYKALGNSVNVFVVSVVMSMLFN